MAVQPHSFSLYSSFGQRLSLTVVAAICFTSFLIWPYSESLLYLVSKALTFSLCCCFFVRQFWLLRHWSCQFILSADGSVRIEQQCFALKGRPIVTPFMVVFDIHCGSDEKRLVVWADMLNDTNYRHLCRLLLLSYRNRLNSDS
ncbi:Conserved hypothetical protein [Shewanella piezotolerans WP3]|uniref:Toxin CptA n=1 Tax=Shewanella piezotolerans (strain WP3 / JCM 13877) TaxID=225849 RepID=B8CQK3_SHEPW|nr:protein YgfX [Shewanella piezotolerans]ACJ30469.1 Conserved hypothetical protein [Shewanella piezotolerans WP3]